MTDVPVAGLAFFCGWIVLLVASDLAALLKMSSKRESQVQNALLLGSIAAAIAFGATAYARGPRGHAAPTCAQHAAGAERDARHAARVSGRTSQTTPT